MVFRYEFSKLIRVTVAIAAMTLPASSREGYDYPELKIPVLLAPPDRKEVSMPDILHRVGIKASPEKVFEALSTIDGIRHWWVVETAGETKMAASLTLDSA